MVIPRKNRKSKKGKNRKGSSSGHTISSSNEEEKAQTKKEEIAKGKKPVEVEMEDQIMSDVEFITRKAKGIVIEEAQEPQTHTDDKNSKAVVMSTYELRSGKKGRGVNVASENKSTNSEPKGRGKKRGRGLRRTVSLSELNEMKFAQNADVIMTKRQKKGKGKKEEETDIFQGSETDPEEACRRIKKGRRNGNDSDEDGAGGGAGAGAGTGAAAMEITA